MINEVAAKRRPVGLVRAPQLLLGELIALDGFVVADDLNDAGKRVAFPAGTTIEPDAYMQFSSWTSDAWPGFALGGDEELGIWLMDGTGVDRVDWEEGDSPEAARATPAYPTPPATSKLSTTPPRAPPTSPDSQRLLARRDFRSERLDRVVVGHGRTGRAQQHVGPQVPLVEQEHQLDLS